jgi:hypothetical protein
LYGATPLLTLLRGQTFERFSPVERPVALLRIHVVQLGEAIEEALLGLPIQILEARLILERPLLVRGR